MSFIKKLNLLRLYMKIIKNNEEELLVKYNMRVDDSYRLYTVLNIPSNLIGEHYTLKKSDIDKISENYIVEYNKDIAKYLNSLGISEMFSYYEIRKVDKFSYLIVIGYRFIRTNRFFRNLYFIAIPLLLILISLFFIFI